MSKILLLGGTGVMGLRLARSLVACGHAVTSTSRRYRMDADGVHYREGNAQEDAFLRAVLRETKPDAIVDFMSYSTKRFAERRDLLLESTAQYAFISSCRVFSGEGLHTENSPRILDVCTDENYLKTDEYALAKARQEDILRDSRRNNWTILRPCLTYAFPRLQFGCLEFSAFAERIRQGLPVPIPEEMLQKRTTMQHGDDAAEMIARLVPNARALGECYNLASGENHTWAEVGMIYEKSLGMKIARCTLEDYMRFTNPFQVVYGRMLHHCFDNSKVLAATGFRQDDFRPLQEGLADEAAKYIEYKDSIAIDIQRNAMIDSILGTKLKVSGARDFVLYARTRYPLVEKSVRMIKVILGKA